MLSSWALLLYWHHGNFKIFHKERYLVVYEGKRRGSIVYFGGFLLIVINFGFFGAIAQLAGFIMIFRTFLPDLYDYICKVPYVGHYLSTFSIRKKAIGFRIS